jgi:hypothetical protein
MSLSSTLQTLNDLKDKVLSLHNDAENEDIRQQITSLDEVLRTMYEHVHTLMVPSSGKCSHDHHTLKKHPASSHV